MTSLTSCSKSDLLWTTSEENSRKFQWLRSYASTNRWFHLKGIVLWSSILLYLQNLISGGINSSYWLINQELYLISSYTHVKYNQWIYQMFLISSPVQMLSYIWLRTSQIIKTSLSTLTSGYSIPLIEHLACRGIWSCGTVRIPRLVGVPKNKKSDKAIIASGRGSYN